MWRLFSFSLINVVVISFLTIASHYRTWALGQDTTDLDNFFGLEDQQDLFGNILDDAYSSSTDIANSQGQEDPWSSSLLQPLNTDTDTFADLDAYMSPDNNAALFASSLPTSKLTGYQSSSSASSPGGCLAEDPYSISSLSSGSLFGRSDGSTDLNNIAATSDNFCFQNPGKPSPPPVPSLPNPFDLLQEDDRDDLDPLGTFPRRPVCAGVYPVYVLCCERDFERVTITSFWWDCEECMYCFSFLWALIFDFFLPRRRFA